MQLPKTLKAIKASIDNVTAGTVVTPQGRFVDANENVVRNAVQRDEKVEDCWMP